MKLAVLPFNATEGTKPAYGRQFVNFAVDTIRVSTQTENLATVSYLAQIDSEDGPRAAFVNLADTLLEADWLQQLFQQSDVEGVFDGLVKENEDGSFDITLRLTMRGEDSPALFEEKHIARGDITKELHSMIKLYAGKAEVALPDNLAGDKLDFGTDSVDAFLKFLEGYDSLTYIQQANGRVAHEFSPEPAIAALKDALELDADFEGPYETLVQLCRACAQYQIGTFEMCEDALKVLDEKFPEDYRAAFALGELYQTVNALEKAADYYEKAATIEQKEPGILSRLGMIQMQMGMPVNAERNFRKALEMEPEAKPSLDLLAGVLMQTNRGHEVPALWKEQLERTPADPAVHAKYAIALLQNGNEEQGIAVFEGALETVEDATVIKRYYAPLLVQKEELDRAMDFYEDVIEAAPSEIPVLLEYAQTLEAANRAFEVPKVLRDVLASNPDPDTRAQTQAWLIRLEQPKRADAVESARAKIESRDFDGAIRDLRPLKNWLSDYWPMWAILSSAHNQLGESVEAEDAARRLIELFPGCEPAYGELIQALNAQGKAEEAYNLMRFTANRMPQSLAAHVNLARAAKWSGRDDEARGLAQQIRQAVGPNEELDAVLAEIER